MRDAINSKKGSTMWYGSEYRPVSQLEGIYHKQKNWDYFKIQLQKGTTYPLQKIGPHHRLQNLHRILERVNHRSAEDNMDIVQELT